MKDLALIGMTVRMASGLPAKVAVLGPMRMHYERVMAAVLQTSRALGSTRSSRALARRWPCDLPAFFGKLKKVDSPNLKRNLPKCRRNETSPR